MKFEKLPLNLNLKFEKNLRLSELQNHYWNFLKTGATIQELVLHFLKLGWLVHFSELTSLIEQLHQLNMIQNKEALELLNHQAVSEKYTQQFQSQNKNIDIKYFRSLPFLRSLDSTIIDIFLRESVVETWAAQSLICKKDDRNRDMFAVIGGQLGVYKSNNLGQRLRVAMMGPQSVFGEVSFFLNQPRTADIVTQSPCQILRIKHLPQYDQWIKQGKAAHLTSRFWIYHAISQSELLRELPEDSIDALAFSGQVYRVQEGSEIFKEASTGTCCYLLVQGSVVVSQKGQAINVLKQGDCLGEIALFYSQGQRTATVTAQAECLILEITQQNFYKVLSENIWLAKEIESIAQARLQRDQQRYKPAG